MLTTEGVGVGVSSPETHTKLLYSRKEAAALLSISTRTLDYLIARKELMAIRIGSKVLIPHAALLSFIRRNHGGRVQ